jgi:Transposase
MGQTHPASLGIDVAKAKFDAALLCEGKLAQRTFAMDPEGFATLCSWIHQRGIEQVHACLEATGEYGAALALSLYEAGHQVSIVNPARIAAYAKSRLARTKTDKSDAALIARFCAQEQPPIWTPPSAESPFTYGKTRRRVRWVFQHHQGEWARYFHTIRLSRTLVAGCRKLVAAGCSVQGEYDARCGAQEAGLL